jgi:hypothetical protein
MILFNYFDILPLQFIVQVPVVPLQRPDEMHPLIHHSSSAYEDISTQHTIPTMITWTYGAKLIFVQGSWDNWKSRFLNLSLLITSYKIVFTVFVFYILIYLFIYLSELLCRDQGKTLQ